MTFDQILRMHSRTVALLIGNGIHLYNGGGSISWDALLLELAAKYGLVMDQLPQGTSATEFFDVLDLRAKGRSGDLGKEFCASMEAWGPASHHIEIMEWASRHGVPVLTTNFDNVLGKAARARRLRPRERGFTDFYPWDTRYAHALQDDPCAGFGIWHVNGMACYARSIRLGLTHYMGSAQRARDWLHRGERRLFAAEDPAIWSGRRTWLHVLFNKPLLIFGLGLGENEVFLRWLLIERARYFAKFPARAQLGWYVCRQKANDPVGEGRAFFLNGVGIDTVHVEATVEIYESAGWRN